MRYARIALGCLVLGAGCYGMPRTRGYDADGSMAGHGGTGGDTGGTGGVTGASAGTAGSGGAAGGTGAAAGGTGGMAGIGSAAGGTGAAAGGTGGSISCPTGQAACSGACVNTLTDGINCGRCSHDCLGGMCSNGSCLPVMLAKVQAATGAIGLALNSSTVFTTSPGNSAAGWSLYGVPKTAVNSSPSPILTTAVGNNRTGFLGGNDTLLFAESGYNNSPGGNASTVISCNPSNCASSQRTWYTLSDAITACDPSTQECFVGTSFSNFCTFQYAKQGTTSQMSPQGFNPVVTMASGLAPAAAGGYLYMAGVYGVDANQTYAVLHRVSEDGVGGISTLANLGPSAQYALDGPLVITSTRVYLVGANIGTNTTGLISVSLPNGVGNSAPSFLEGTTMPSGNWIAAWGDDTAIYFANPAQQWATCPASGCAGARTALADASSALPYLVGDAQAIYWIDRTTDTGGRTAGFSIMKIAR
jgi:hypothetical protein